MKRSAEIITQREWWCHKSPPHPPLRFSPTLLRHLSRRQCRFNLHHNTRQSRYWRYSLSKSSASYSPSYRQKKGLLVQTSARNGVHSFSIGPTCGVIFQQKDTSTSVSAYCHSVRTFEARLYDKYTLIVARYLHGTSLASLIQHGSLTFCLLKSAFICRKVY